MSPQRKALVVILVAVALVVGMVNAFALTATERKKAQLALDAVKAGLQQNMDLRYEAAQARAEASTANSSAGSAWASAFSVGVTAKKAVEDAEKCQKTVAEWAPIIKAVTGPWWFQGGNALIYGAKKSAISLLVIIFGAALLFVVVRVLITMATGGTVTAGLSVAGGWFARAGKRLLFFLRRRGKSAVDNIQHRTIGSDDDP